jgi:predicted ATPase
LLTDTMANDNITQLQLIDVPLFGRDAELRALDDLFDECVAGGAAVVAVHGMAGVGKSSVARARLSDWKRKCDTKNQGLLVATGKYEKHRTAEPFSAITELLNELVTVWATTNEAETELSQFALKLQADAHVLVPVLPRLSDLLSKAAHEPTATQASALATEVAATTPVEASSPPPPMEQQNHHPRRPISCMSRRPSDSIMKRVRKSSDLGALLAALWRLFSCLCRSTRPMVLLLDDLQWADQSSFEILKLLAMSDLKGLLLITTYREEEVNETHIVTTTFQEMERMPAQHSQSKSCLVQKIGVPALTVVAVNQLISFTVKRDLEACQPLSKLVHDQTGGNPFYALQFLKTLCEEDLLRYSLVSYQWEWNTIDQIQRIVKVSENVADIVASSMRKLPLETQQFLMVASCLGVEVPVDVVSAYLATVAEEEEKHGDNQSNNIVSSNSVTAVVNALLPAVTAGILTLSVQTNTYRWTHDKLQHAGYSLIPQSSRARIHFHLGKLLWTMSENNPDKQWMIYMAADQLNKGCPVGLSSVDLARLNLEAATLAMAKSAFYPAADLLRAGASRLDKTTRWTDHYSLSLELLNSLAEAECVIGNHTACMEVVNEVLEHGRTLDDKYRAHTLKLDCLASGVNRDYESIVEVCLSILKLYDVDIPSNPSRWFMMRETQKLRTVLPGKSLDSLLDLPEMVDIKALQVSHLLSEQLSQNAANSGKFSLARVAASMAIRLAVSKGVSTNTAIAVQFLSLAMMINGELQDSYKHGIMAVKLCGRYDESIGGNHAKIRGSGYSSIIALLRPFHESLEPLLEAYRTGIRTGNMEWSSLSAMFYSLCYLCIGLPLGPLEPDLISFGQEARQFGRPYSVVVLFQIYRQTILNLRDEVDVPTVLKGAAMDQDDVVKEMEGKAQKMTVRDITTSRLMLACIYSDFEVAKAMIDILAEYPFRELITFRGYLRATYIGLAALVLGRQRGNGKYAEIGKKIISSMKADAKLGAVNSLPVLLMLKAEQNPTKETYNEAIKACARSGLVHYQAYMCERAGLHLLHEKDEAGGEFMIGRSLDLYRDWGAFGKVLQMKQNHACLSNRTESSVMSTHMKGRSRHQQQLADSLKTFQMEKDPKLKASLAPEKKRDSVRGGLRNDSESSFSSDRLESEEHFTTRNARLSFADLT